MQPSGHSQVATFLQEGIGNESYALTQDLGGIWESSTDGACRLPSQKLQQTVWGHWT